MAELSKMALMPCHAFFQFYVAPPQAPGERGKLSCQLYQRSADIFLGVPFNIASYALLTHMVAQQCDLDVGDFIWTGGDCHIYSNHAEQVALQLSREPRPYPTLRIKRKPDSIFDYQYEDFAVRRLRPAPGHQGAGGGLSEAMLHAPQPDLRPRRQRRDRQGQRPALAPAGRHGPLQAHDRRLPGRSWAARPGTRCRRGSGRSRVAATSWSRARPTGRPRVPKRAPGLREAMVLCANAPKSGSSAARRSTPRRHRSPDAPLSPRSRGDYDGDAQAPMLDAGWRETARDSGVSSNGLAFSFVTLERR